MRFNVELLLENEIIPKDKNRVFLSFLKHNYSSYDNEYFESQYENTKNKTKSFTFSLYMENCKFLKDEIIIPNKNIILNFSTADMEDGIMFYNSILSNIGKKYDIKNNSITVKKISLVKEKLIRENEVIFKTMSPIIVKEHNGDNKKTWYHSLNEKTGQELLLKNLNYYLINIFGEYSKKDIEEIKFELLSNKEVKIKNYGIEVLGNIAKFKLEGKPYLLEYLYKSGIGSLRNSGFGMLDIV